jgi:hypothetical protein
MKSAEALELKIKNENASFLRYVYHVIEERSDDIDLDHAMLAWNRDTKRVAVIRHPDKSNAFNRLNLYSDIGASFMGWKSIPTYERLLTFANMSFRLHIDHAIPMETILKALDVIPEWRHMRMKA